MKKILSYREKLLELASIYKINEIKNYTQNKKYLTTAQIEHILRKSRVPVPKEINKSKFEILSKKISKPIYSTINYFSAFVNSTIKTFYDFYKSTIKTIKHIKNFLIFIVTTVENFFIFIKKTTINFLNKLYDFKVQEKKANRVVSVASLVICLFLFGAVFFKTSSMIFEKKSLIVEEKKESKEKIVAKKEKKKLKPKPKLKAETLVKLPKKKLKTETKPKKEKEKSNSVSEFVLPNLNLKTATVLSLFEDVEYDLTNVRNNKLVKPIYFTQFPKDLIEIKSVKLKKETFIKIVLPLVVAENQKILSDKIKFRKIIKKKMTSDKEKLWLKVKFKEYKVKNMSVEELDKRMDIIPISIALAQAAKESGWGTSRFALEGNAIFGQWTWSGKGLAPLDRSEELSHKILRFPILRASVKAYKNNLNTHKSYKEFRNKRLKARAKKKNIKGLDLIATLDNYAETGKEYTKILAKIIKQNNLDDFENVRLTNSIIKRALNL